MEWITNAWNGIVEWVAANSGDWLSWLASVGLGLLKALVITILGFWLAAIIVRVLRKALSKTKMEKGASGFICSFTNYLLKLIVVISVIATLGINITSIITALGAAGITLGLAMQDSLSNFASGVLILFNHPFRVGDFVEAEGVSGTVKQIELMYTVLLTPDNKEIVFPNSKLTADKILNYTAQTNRRIDLTFRVAVDSDIEKVKQCLRNACAASPFVNQSITPDIGVNSFTADAVVFDMRPWIGADYWPAYYDLNERVLCEFRKAGVALPASRVQIVDAGK